MGKRNQMLFLKPNARTIIPLEYPRVDEIQNKILNGQNFILTRKIDLLDDERTNELKRKINEEKRRDLISEENLFSDEDVNLIKHKIPLEEVIDNIQEDEVVSPISDFELMAKAQRTKSRAKTLSEDSGVDALFLVLKVVSWRESIDSDVWHKAPLIMVPTTLQKNKGFRYTFNPSEDDITLNPALKIYFQKNFQLEIPDLFENENGYDLDSYFETIQKLVSEFEFKILDESYIGIFAFSKLAMYKDIETNFDDLIENDFVKVMTGGEVTFSGDDSILAEIDKNLDSITTSENNMIVVDADGSQLRAIEMAKAGMSFVIQGPPGTGKSQTITNLIAELIAKNKKVLFVSEKLAALNVVKSNLSKVNLDEFCLVLHNTKTKKDVVIEELFNAFSASRLQATPREQDIHKRDVLRKELSAYVENIHQKGKKLGLSIYSAISRFYSYDENIPFISSTELLQFTTSTIQDVVNLLLNYLDFLPHFLPKIENNPLYGIRSNLFKDNELLEKEVWENQQNRLELLTDSLALFGVDSAIVKNQNLKTLFKLEKNIIVEEKITYEDIPDVSSLWFEVDKEDFILENITKLSEAVKNLTNSKDMEEQYNNVLDINNGLLNEIAELRDKFFWFVSPKFYKKVKELNSYRKTKVPIKLIKDEINSVLLYQKNNLTYQEIKKEISKYFEYSWRDFDTDFTFLSKQVSLILRLKQTNKLTNDFISGISATSVQLELDSSNFLKLNNAFINLKELIVETKVAHNSSLSILLEHKLREENLTLDEAIRQVNIIALNIDKYSKWVDYSQIHEKLATFKLINFLDSFHSENNNISCLIDSLKKSFYFVWANKLIDQDPMLASFVKKKHENKIFDFVKIDRDLIEHNRFRVRELATANKPVFDETFGAGGEQSILVANHNKKRNKLSVRKLFKAIPNLIKELKPVIMMSPITVSNYLNMDDFKFDVLIFDEASQIFPYDAIGCLARANQVIIAGDRHQLPPTNFFLTSDDLPEDEEDDEYEAKPTEFESILDLANSRLRMISLLWHYRSKNEDLIAFSNQEIYSNNLITFPSINDGIKNQGVEFIFVEDGVYDRGKSKTNRKEAEKVVDLIFEHVKNHEEKSLGIVTVNSSQQELIESLLNKRIVNNRKVESFVNGETNYQEPFFIKNIESVQGDERDTIIFDLGYGKDSGGNFSMGFGPINKVGGERRLNVAITRAKQNIKVVASVHGYDFRINENTPRGVKLLSDYLEFAERGASFLSKIVKNNDQVADSAFEEDVSRFLESKGYMVEKQVGVSSFRIDLAIRDPKRPKVFVLGIECDGATYHSGKTARDRDSLRQQVLERLGWKIYRVWSTDWFVNNLNARKDLIRAVESAINGELKNNSKLPIANDFKIIDKTIPKEPQEIKIPLKELKFQNYEYADAIVSALTGKYGVRYDYPGYNGFVEIFQTILKRESPVHFHRMIELFMPYFGKEKRNRELISQFEFLVNRTRHLGKISFQQEGLFYLTPGQQKFPFRKCDESKPRILSEIYPKEYIDLFEKLFERQKKIEREGLIKLIAINCGYKKLTKKITGEIDNLISTMLYRKILYENGVYISLKNFI